MGTRHWIGLWTAVKSWWGGAEAYLPQRLKELLHHLGMGASLLQRELWASAEMGRKQRRLYGNRQRVTRAKGGGVCCEAAFSPEGFAQAQVLSFRLRKGLGEVAREG